MASTVRRKIAPLQPAHQPSQCDQRPGGRIPPPHQSVPVVSTGTNPTRRPFPPSVQWMGQNIRVTSDFLRLDEPDAMTRASISQSVGSPARHRKGFVPQKKDADRFLVGIFASFADSGRTKERRRPGAAGVGAERPDNGSRLCGPHYCEYFCLPCTPQASRVGPWPTAREWLLAGFCPM